MLYSIRKASIDCTDGGGSGAGSCGWPGSVCVFSLRGSADLRLFVRLAASEAVAKSLEHVRVGVST